MNALGAIAVDAGIWAASGVLVGLGGGRLPSRALAADGAITRLRPWEREGRFWLATGVRRWKPLLPDLGGLGGGTPKKRLPWAPGSRDRLLVETRRAELVHWAAAVPVVAMVTWGPAWVSAVMVAYAFGANAPCIIVQRYNRGRLLRVAARRVARPGATRAGAGERPPWLRR